MRSGMILGGTLGLALVALTSSGASADDRDVRVCYKDTTNRETRLVLDIKLHSRLPTYDRRLDQRVYDTDGKHTFSTDGGRTSYMAVFDGAIVTSSGSHYVQRGAHLGGTSYFVRGGTGVGPQGGTNYPIAWECSSTEYSQAPRNWYCTVRAENLNGVPATLERLDYPDQLCDAFQDSPIDSHPH